MVYYIGSTMPQEWSIIYGWLENDSKLGNIVIQDDRERDDECDFNNLDQRSTQTRVNVLGEH